MTQEERIEALEYKVEQLSIALFNGPADSVSSLEIKRMADKGPDYIRAVFKEKLRKEKARNKLKDSLRVGAADSLESEIKIIIKKGIQDEFC